MLENLGWLELLVLILVALFIIGPDRLPKVLADGLEGLRKIRTMARSATSDLSRELGTTIELEDLHPKTFLRKHLLSEAEEAALRKPFEDVYSELRSTTDAVNFGKESGRPAAGTDGAAVGSADRAASADRGSTGDHATTPVTGPRTGPAYDDAT